MTGPLDPETFIGPSQFGEPVDLPDGVEHCGPTAYNYYGCRCRYCRTWRLLYDRANRVHQAAERASKRRVARDYLAYRGVQVWGSGPFRSNPVVLAKLVAGYLGDDLEQWFRRRDESRDE